MFFSATSQFSVSTPISRWVTMDFLWVCTYSIGSSIVMMWSWLLLLRQSTSAASEVDLPEPVPPTKITRPRLISAMSFSTSGRLSWSKVGSRC
ncbi:Uncharacterised protein [Chromobacterium violaceum]|uniref:Uncharacterized protein n=1 Tax=Chromobacterium violaceum TaxID=536 RepID=A0A447T4L9_CHRVL|nr:Uncharacterised protein [Chromobacterium violaceum]